MGVVMVVVMHRLADELGHWAGDRHDDREEDVGRHKLVRVRVRVTEGEG